MSIIMQHCTDSEASQLPNVYSSYLPVIGVHSTMHLMHPNYWQITILLVVDLCSSLAYFMMTHPLPIAGKMPIKTMVAKQIHMYCDCVGFNIVYVMTVHNHYCVEYYNSWRSKKSMCTTLKLCS